MINFAFDLDGVTIISPLFTENIHKKYGVDPGAALAFIKGEYQECIRGEKDLKTIIPKYLKEWGLDLSVDELLEFWFEAENHPNQELINYIQTLRSNEYKCYLATNQEKYRIEYIRSVMNFNSYFDDIFTSCELKIDKPKQEYFANVTEKIGCNPNEVHFFDDRPQYVEEARKFGWQASVYVSNENTIREINKLTHRKK